MADEFDSFFAKATGVSPIKINNVDLSGSDSILSEQLQKANAAYQEQYGKELPLTSGARTAQQQQSLVDRAAQGDKNIFMPAKVQLGKDMYHDTAVDISREIPPEFAKRLETEFNLHRPFGAKDPVHWEVHPQFKQVAQANAKDQQGLDFFFEQITPKEQEKKPTVSEIDTKKFTPQEKEPLDRKSTWVDWVAENVKPAALTHEQQKEGEAVIAKKAARFDTLFGIVPALTQLTAYATGRGISLAAGMNDAETAAKIGDFSKDIAERVSAPFAKAIGVDRNDPNYANEASQKIMHFVGENLEKGAGYIAEKTGLPKDDAEFLVNTVGVALAHKAGGELIKAAKEEIPIAGVKAEPSFTGEKPVQAMAEQPKPAGAEKSVYETPEYIASNEKLNSAMQERDNLARDAEGHILDRNKFVSLSEIIGSELNNQIKLLQQNEGVSKATAESQIKQQFEMKGVEQLPTKEAVNEPLAGSEIQQTHQAKIAAQKSIPIDIPTETANVLKQKLGDRVLLPEVAQQISDAVKRGEQINPDAVVLHNKARQFGIELTPGQKTLDANLISKELNERGMKDAYVARFNEQSGLLHEAANKVKSDVAPSLTTKDYVGDGELAIDQVNNIVEQNKKTTTDAYKALDDANGGKFPVDGKAIAKDAIDKLMADDRLDYLPPVIAKKLEAYASGNKQMNFNLFENLRTDLAAEMRKADRASDGTAKNALSVVRDSLESLPLEPGMDKFKGLADTARKAFKADKDLEASNKLYSDVKNGVADTKTFIDNVVFRGKNNEFTNAIKLVNSDPIAKEALASGALDVMIRKSTDASGNFKPAMFSKMIEDLDVNRRLEPLFGRQKSNELRDLAEVGSATMARPRGSFVNESNTAVAAMALAKDMFGAVTTKVPVVGPVLGGLGTAANLAKSFKSKIDVGKSLKPGAGISSKKTKLKDIGKD